MAQLSNNEPLDYKLKKLDKERHTLTIKLHVTKQFKIRMFIAKKLMGFVSFVLGCGIKIEEKEENDIQQNQHEDFKCPKCNRGNYVIGDSEDHKIYRCLGCDYKKSYPK